MVAGAALEAGERGSARRRLSEIQRARITGAMCELVHERGAGGVTVAHIVQRSGISRRTFYELFEDREACFLAAFDRAIAMAGESVIPAYQDSGRWRERIRAGLCALLEFFDAEPDMGFLCVVGALGGGRPALERRAVVVEALVAEVHKGRRDARASRKPDRLVAEGLVGAVLAVIHTRMREHSPKPLVGLLGPLTGMIVLPYLGTAAAEREIARPAPTAPRHVRPHGNPLRELDMRLTYRTVRALLAIAAHPAASNREVSAAAGITDQGQISKLLARLQNLGLIHNDGNEHGRGEPNAWTLTATGEDLAHVIATQSAPADASG